MATQAMQTHSQKPRYTTIGEGRRLVLAMCATSFMATLMYGSLAPFFSELKADLNSSTPALGQVVTLRLVLSAMLAVIAGPVADRYGYRRLLTLGMFALALSFFAVSVAQNYAMLLLSGIPGGVAGGILSGLPLAFIANSFDGEARLKAISYTVAALSSSSIIGIPILTTASAWVGWRGVFLGSGLVAVLCAVALYRILPVDHRSTSGEARISLGAIITGYRPLVADREMMRLFGATLFRSIGWLGFLTYLGAYLADDVGLSTREIGLVYMFSGAGYFLGSLLAGRLRSARSVATVAAVMTVITGLAVLVAMSASSIPAVAIAGVFGVTFSSSIAWVMFTTLLTSTTPVGQGATMSLNSTVVSLGSAGGGIVGGLLIATAGYAVLGMGLAIALVVSALFILQGSIRRESAGLSRERVEGQP